MRAVIGIINYMRIICKIRILESCEYSLALHCLLLNLLQHYEQGVCIAVALPHYGG